MFKWTTFASFVLALSVLLALAPPHAAPASPPVVPDDDSAPVSYTEFSVPGAGTTAYLGTNATAINTANEVVGFYLDSKTVYHGYLRLSNGTITTFDAPNAGTGKNQGTHPIGVNTGQTIAGMVADSGSVEHGFVRSSTGVFTEFDAPGAGNSQNRGTIPLSINKSGTIVGMVKDSTDVHHGFLRTSAGTIKTFDVPAAGKSATQGTSPYSINSGGQIAGSYKDSNSVYHGFLRAANGAITSPIDAPGAAKSSTTFFKDICCGGTYVTSIDNSGNITGVFTDSKGVYHGFIRSSAGAITEFDAPGAGTGASQGTISFAVNAGVIAGFYNDSSNQSHGFTRATTGTITTFDAPGFGGSGLLSGTISFAINSAGDIVGAYTDSSYVIHAYLRNPK